MSKITISSGEFRGRQISTPDTSLVHPMGSREKLALFNTLESLRGPLTSDTTLLDCFCGSGALGLEALSRGAGEVVFVDQNPKAVTATKQNILALGVSSRAHVLKTTYQNLLKTLETPQKSPKNHQNPHETPQQKSQNRANVKNFDIIIADPPYDNYPENLNVLSNLLATGGILVLSHPTSINPADILSNCELIRTKKYAAANLSYFVKHMH